MTITTRDELVEAIASGLPEEWSHSYRTELAAERLRDVLSALNTTAEALIALANGGVVVPGHLSGIIEAIQNAGNIRIWNNINYRDGRRIEIKFSVKATP